MGALLATHRPHFNFLCQKDSHVEKKAPTSREALCSPLSGPEDSTEANSEDERPVRLGSCPTEAAPKTK